MIGTKSNSLHAIAIKTDVVSHMNPKMLRKLEDEKCNFWASF